MTTEELAAEYAELSELVREFVSEYNDGYHGDLPWSQFDPWCAPTRPGTDIGHGIRKGGGTILDIVNNRPNLPKETDE